MTKHRSTLIAAGTAVAIAAGAGGVAVAAKDIRPAQTYQERLADELGVSESKLRAAGERAAKGTVADLERAGQIDGKRADRLTKAAERGKALPFTRLGKPAGRAGPRRAGLEALATSLKLDRRALVAELRKGTAPAKLITDRGADRDATVTAVRDAIRGKLDARVRTGRLPGERADKIAERMSGRLTGDEPLRRGRRARG